jgi:hypothetical protein
MTNPDYTHIALVVDRSGSMASIKTDMEGGLKTYLEEQAALPGKCLVDLTIFDTDIDQVYTGRPVGSATVGIVPRGATALLDAIGKTVVSLGERLAKLSEDDRPEHVIVATITDGYENSSREFTHGTLQQLIEEQQAKWNWKFVFLGAGLDASKQGAGMGMAKGMSSHYAPTSAGVAMGTQSLSNYTSAVRGGDQDAKLDEDSA